ncbi:phage holin family protein [Microbacterium sp. BK668]|uniref:phage holin family protein n=1 Tax=Microbacterium sp. BK668 TaxID=2512118 RepID=UPI00105E8D59|nr:phage holin family protein [Microbacterium sp. BK668]
MEPSRAAPLDDSTPSERQAANSSLGELVTQVLGDMSTLMRQEIELAKAEIRESAKTSAKAGAMLGAAGYAGHLTILFLSIALWWALGYLIGNGWSALVVAVIWGIVAAILFVVGRNNMKKVQGAPQTVETLKEIPDTLKRNEENR